MLCMPRNFIVVVQFFSVKYVLVIIDEEEQWRLVCMSHEGVSTTVEAKAMSGYFGRNKTVSLLSSKVYFPNITHKVKQFVDSCEACQRVKAGSKFEKGGDKLKSIHVPLETWTQLGIDLITNLPKTPEGYNTIVTYIDYTSKFVESKPLIGKCAEGVAQFMYELPGFIYPTREGSLSVRYVYIPLHSELIHFISCTPEDFFNKFYFVYAQELQFTF